MPDSSTPAPAISQEKPGKSGYSSARVRARAATALLGVLSPILPLLILALATPSAVAGKVGCLPAAYASYLEGRSLLGQRTSRDLRHALELFSLAIAEDPGCAPALAGRARAHALLFDYSAARKALELEPASALYELNLGYRMFWAR